MDNCEKARYEEMAKVSKALAHATRLYIVEKLNEKEFCLKELTQMIGADNSTVSKHLTVLKNAGIISDEKRGNCVYFKLLCPCVLNIFGCVINVIDSNKKRQNELSI